jgi:hypothetical protein
MSDEAKCYVTMCPSCKKWQSKPSRNFGKEVNEAECVYCRKKFNIKVNGKLVDCRAAPGIVAGRNAPADNRVGFKRAIFRGGQK